MDTDIVYRNENGVAVTTSYLVAETFGKNHKRVLEDIDRLNCSEAFRKPNFGLSLKLRELPNGGHKEDRYYVITKDGFTILAMGYTGKKAMEFKEKYIAAFNAMEQQLRQGTAQNIEGLSRKQILQMALEAEEEKERMAARLALAENRNAELQASVESILPRLEQLEKRMGEPQAAPQPVAQTEFQAPKTSGKKRPGIAPRDLRRDYPEYKSSREVLKWLKMQGLRIQNFEFYAFLRQNGLASSDDLTYNMPTDMAINNGWMLPAQSGTHPSIDGRYYYTPYFSPEGMKYILSALQSLKTIHETPLFAQNL